MTDLVTWSGDGLSAGAMSTGSAGTGDDAPAGSQGSFSGITIDASGTRSPRIKETQAASTACAVYWSHTASAPTSGRLYFEISGAPASSYSLIQINTATTKAMKLDLTAARAIRITDSTGAIIQTSSSAAVATGTVYRLEWQLDCDAGTCAVQLYVGESTTPSTSISGSGNYLTDIARIYLGNVATSPTVPTQYYDDIRIVTGTTAVGPILSIDAGADQVDIEPGATVTLTAVAPSGVTVTWSQTGGSPTVTLS